MTGKLTYALWRGIDTRTFVDDQHLKSMGSHKDLEICRKMAEQNLKTRIPLAEHTVADYEKLMAQGYGDEDTSALYRLARHG